MKINLFPLVISRNKRWNKLIDLRAEITKSAINLSAVLELIRITWAQPELFKELMDSEPFRKLYENRVTLIDTTRKLWEEYSRKFQGFRRAYPKVDITDDVALNPDVVNFVQSLMQKHTPDKKNG